jgi:hypothetical protein
MRTEVVRTEVERLLRQGPWRPFVMTLENGDRLTIEHPENIAFQPGPQGSRDFYAISGALRIYSNFDAVTSIALLDRDEDESEDERVA